MPTYSDDGLIKLKKEFNRFSKGLDQFKLGLYRIQLSAPSAIRYRNEGLLRRISLISQTIFTIFETIPPETAIPPDKATVDLATICLHANIINTFGILDNIAHVWVEEFDIRAGSGKPLPKTSIGLNAKCKIVRRSFGEDFQNLLNERDPWIQYLESYRHTLAHRVPLYIPPHLVDPSNEENYRILNTAELAALDRSERESLKANKMAYTHFKSIMVHDLDESREVFFHAQLLVDFLTIKELCHAFKSEIEKRQQS